MNKCLAFISLGSGLVRGIGQKGAYKGTALGMLTSLDLAGTWMVGQDQERIKNDSQVSHGDNIQGGGGVHGAQVHISRRWLGQ